jgi:hypothetical protein
LQACLSTFKGRSHPEAKSMSHAKAKALKVYSMQNLKLLAFDDNVQKRLEGVLKNTIYNLNVGV